MDQQLQVQATTSTTLNDEADTCVGTVDSVAVPIPPDLVPLLESTAVAKASLETLISTGTGHVIDLRRLDPLESLRLTDEEDVRLV